MTLIMIDNFYCCSHCKGRISKLQIMMNQLYCYISDFLPEELDGLIQQPQEMYKPSNRTNGLLEDQDKLLRMKGEKQKGGHKIRKQAQTYSSKLKKSSEQSQKQGKRSKEYSIEQKKELVAKVQEGCRNGQKVKQVCTRLGISDRSYQRWKGYLEEGQAQDLQSDEFVIQAPYL